MLGTVALSAVISTSITVISTTSSSRRWRGSSSASGHRGVRPRARPRRAARRIMARKRRLSAANKQRYKSTGFALIPSPARDRHALTVADEKLLRPVG